MQISPEQLEAAILQLPAHVRARLAEVLIQSLDEAAELDIAWADEADRRFEELRTGTATAVPAADAFAKARARLQ